MTKTSKLTFGMLLFVGSAMFVVATCGWFFTPTHFFPSLQMCGKQIITDYIFVQEITCCDVIGCATPHWIVSLFGMMCAIFSGGFAFILATFYWIDIDSINRDDEGE